MFVVATVGLRIYLSYITRTGYTYGALATLIAFLLFAFFLGFAIMIGAELNAAIDEEWLARIPKATSCEPGCGTRPGRCAPRRQQRTAGTAGAPRGEPTGALGPGQPFLRVS